jgi:hypothetical protein
MRTEAPLFPSLMGEAWNRLDPVVQRVHGGRADVVLRGTADVDGSPGTIAQWLRRTTGVPSPGPAQPVTVEIVRDADGECWTRRFARGWMRSRLSTHDGQRLRERLGPVELHFRLDAADGAIHWHLLGARILGLPLPRRWLGRVSARSGADGGRYAFSVEASLPGIGCWIAYQGMLEIDDGD